MLAKYCRRHHLVIKKAGKGASHSWKQLCKIKDKVEEHLVWLVGKGEISFWYDNWTVEGPLCSHINEGVIPKDIKLKEVLINGGWHKGTTGILWPNSLRNSLQNIVVELDTEKPDRPIWTPDSRGQFSVSSVWKIFR